MLAQHRQGWANHKPALDEPFVFSGNLFIPVCVCGGGDLFVIQMIEYRRVDIGK